MIGLVLGSQRTRKEYARRVSGLGFRVLGFRVLGFRVSGLGFRVSYGTGYGEGVR